MFKINVAFLIGVMILTAQLQLHAQGSDETGLVTIDLGKDRFAAGQDITVTNAVAGDLLAAGREVIFDEKVGGDAVAAGGTIRLNANVSDNAYAAGGRVYVNGAIARNARLAGGDVEIAPSARIDGGASIAAGQAHVNGAIGSYLQAAGGSLYLNGPVGGDVNASARQIELGPDARISGKLRYRSNGVLKQDPGAQVLGGIEQLPFQVRRAPAVARGFALVMFWVWTFGLMVLVAILFLLPGFTNVIGMLETRPGASALLGFVLLVCIPIASLILLITLIGAPLALLSIAAYFALLLVGYIAAAAAIGDLLLKWLRHKTAETAGWRILAAICGIVIIALLGRIPFLGGLIVFVALIMGIGAVGLQMYRAVRPASPAPVSLL
jgi:cytoskeletal protein CcmA (bactofilin family)